MEWQGIFVGKHPEVYEPSDDTFLLAKVISEAVPAGTRFLEVGCGAGLVSMAAAKNGAQVTATDINPFAVALARRNAKENRLRITVHETDLMAGVAGPFDAIAFNPPYLPTAEDERVSGPLNHAFDGGLSGNDVVLRFVEQLGGHAWKADAVYVIHSSLSDPQPLVDAMDAIGYPAHDVVADEKHFMERLTVRRFSPESKPRNS